ncbi:MAG: hypothetical protein HYX78_10995 [Armatimonadetes bacterium]|nr:hypothetical protein [Armatimonadota bacterium]
MLITVVDVTFVLAGLTFVTIGLVRRKSAPEPEPALPLTWAELSLGGAALVAAGIGPNILVVALTPGMPEMPALGKYALLPSLALLGLAWVAAAIAGLRRLTNRIWVGIYAGAAATAVLDVVRLTGFSLGFMPGNMPRMFGVLLFDQMAVGPSTISDIIGYLYHYWVGACFGLTYTLMVGWTRWWGALIWGVLIELGMMVTPPMVIAMDTGYFGLKQGPGILIVSLTAHVAYGVIMGLLIQRYVRSRGHLPGLVWQLLWGSARHSVLSSRSGKVNTQSEI